MREGRRAQGARPRGVRHANSLRVPRGGACPLFLRSYRRVNFRFTAIGRRRGRRFAWRGCAVRQGENDVRKTAYCPRGSPKTARNRGENSRQPIGNASKYSNLRHVHETALLAPGHFAGHASVPAALAVVVALALPAPVAVALAATTALAETSAVAATTAVPSHLPVPLAISACPASHTASGTASLVDLEHSIRTSQQRCNLPGHHERKDRRRNPQGHRDLPG